MDEVLEVHVSKINIGRPSYRKVIHVLRKSDSGGQRATDKEDLLIIIQCHQSGTSSLIIHI